MGTTVKEVKNSYDFPIKLAPIQSDSILIPKKFAVIREDIKQPIGIVSDQYSLVKHSDAIDCFREALKGNKFEEKVEIIKNGAQLFSTYKLTDTQVEVSKGDIVAMQLILKNSYDGSNSLQIILGAFRLVCTNGMVVGSEFFRYSQKHITSGKPAIDVLKQNVTALVNQFKNSLPAMQAMSKAKLTATPEKLFDAKTLEFPKYLANEASLNYKESDKNTVWTYYNALTYAISHKMKKDSPNARFYYLQRAWEKSVAMVK